MKADFAKKLFHASLSADDTARACTVASVLGNVPNHDDGLPGLVETDRGGERRIAALPA